MRISDWSSDVCSSDLDGKVVGVVNLDMPVLLYDFTDVVAFGAEHSTLGPIVERAAGRMDVALAEDPMPEQGLFTRSDHYRFVQEEIGRESWREIVGPYV